MKRYNPIMSNRSIGLDETLHQYLLTHGVREPEVLRRLREETARLPEAVMQIAPEEGQFLNLLVRLTGARRIIEVGTFTGYSSIAMALAVPEGGLVLCCDLSHHWTAIARRYWQEAGVEDRIDLRLAPARATLDLLVAEGWDDFDMAFIDADKENYLHYYEACLKLLRPGGLIVVDNTLWDGAVADPENHEPSTEAIRAFNERVYNDERVDLSMIPVADGLTLLRKRP